MSRVRYSTIAALTCLAMVFLVMWVRGGAAVVKPAASTEPVVTLAQQTDLQALTKSAGCITCHKGIEPMHESKNVRLGCVDCHGGDPCATTKEDAHIHPRFPERWPTSRNPERTYALLNNENPAFVRFINPGDWRSVSKTCGTAGCHPLEVDVNKKSMMGHSCMVPGSAVYNNGIAPLKNYAFGESYGEDGRSQRMFSSPKVTPEDTKYFGAIDHIDPVPRFEIFPPGNIFRILEINNNATSARGVGTDFRIDAGVLNVVKTKLNDPTMVFMGTNDHPGDYRNSGCTSCHVIYANDRDAKHSERYAKFGNHGYYSGNDPTIPKNEPGHPIEHKLTSAIPSVQCVNCHFHQGSGGIGNYYGYMWWDYESDADKIYPITGLPGINGNVGYISPIGGAVGGPKYKTHELAPTVNPQIFGNKLADWHNAGWLYQAVYKRDRKGNLVDNNDKVIPEGSADWHKRAIHLADIHLDKGMHCIDCHFKQDNHGNGRIYNSMMDAIEINCKDCHGTTTEVANFKTSNRIGGNDLLIGRTPFGQRRFIQKDGQWYQRSSVTKGLEWPVVQVKDTVTPGNPRYSEKSMYAKTIRRDGKTWGPPANKDDCDFAHTEKSMTCYVCHSSWNTQCSGCHLDARTNIKSDNLHYEGEYSKVMASYNPDVLRSDGFMIARMGSVQNNRVSPVRAASSVYASARDGNRAIVAHQQPTIAAEGHSGLAFTTNPPHTVRIKETRACSDCHVSDANDNNAVMAKVLGLGARTVDFVGRYVWVATREKGIAAHRHTCEEDFPEPVIGSTMHQHVNPESFATHIAHDRVVDYKNLGLARTKGRKPESPDDPDGWVQRHKSCDARSIQRYGEYVLVADGSGGMKIYDIANVANKNLAQRIVESPLSPLGQNLRIPCKDCNHVALATTFPVDTERSHLPDNEEQPVHKLMSYCYIADGVEGLIIANIHTLVDGNPSNNFMHREVTFNPDGILNGARYVKIGGHYAYVLCDAGMVVVDINRPKCPKVCGTLGAPDLNHPRSMDIQFRYAFVCDCEGLKIVDITSPCTPHVAAVAKLHDARDVKVMRTYAYVANGADGLAIIDVETPTHPGEAIMFNAGGCINDATGVVVGATLMSLYVYVADGHNGIRVIEVASPDNGTDVKGFSPVPRPKLLATFPTKGPAVYLSEGFPRDRYVDESGNQIGCFGRRGSRPFTQEELERMYLKDGHLFTVSDTPTTKPTIPPKK